jgi:GT2 family glycosyltransferase
MILCSVATRGRYHTTLPLTLQAIINQTLPVDKLVIFDDNDEAQDMRNELIYAHFFQMLDIKGIKWEWLYAQKKGQHHIHQMANSMGYEWVWRVDDDALPEPNVLERLYSFTKFFDKVGAVGGSILTPPVMDTSRVAGTIDLIDLEPNIQWGMIKGYKQVEHLHCSFLYRAGIHDYNLNLSRVAHREETLFTYGLHKRGYGVYAVSNAVSWHLKNPNGGIRSETKREMYEHDEHIFRTHLKYKDYTVVILNCGLGDHLVFSKVLPKIKNPLVFTCYPEIIEGKSIAEAQAIFGNIDQYSIYKKMDDWKWTRSLQEAFERMYL